MFIYFWILRLAALFGHKKARLLVDGQARALREIEEYVYTRPVVPEKPAAPERKHSKNKAQVRVGDAVQTSIFDILDQIEEPQPEPQIEEAPAVEEKPTADNEGIRGAIWIHAASVGEFEQARPLIELLRKRMPEQKILLTFFSPSGYEMRKNYDRVDLVTYLPFATRKNAKRMLDLVQPKMVIFVKYEFWPAYLHELRQRCIRTYLISGIFYRKQLFFRWYGAPYRRLLECFTRLYVQDKNSMQLLKAHGIMHVDAPGDTRFDRVTDVCKNRKRISVIEAFLTEPHTRVLVAGSTWPADERILARYVEERPDIKLILVPHEIDEEHLEQIFHYFEGKTIRYTEATEALAVKTPTMIVDTMGLLSSLYQYAQVAYVGGGFGAGIHNTLEPAVYGIPVVFGPKYKPFREARNLIKNQAAISGHDYATIAEALDQAFINQIFMGTAADEYCRSELGATEAIYNELLRQI